ncbi:MAG TPA: hypothetical protein CFH81_00335 [Sulfurovum sp. UBA12169]|nr:MAG TPA: hypothetical protein CFH81_00335 [Sulfurovum sp. UBA12169]
MVQIRLANIVGLDINNAQHSVAIDEALIGIEDTEAFLQFCRDKKDGIEYTTKPERLDALATRYKKQQQQTKLPHATADSFCDKIVQKVNTSRIKIKNMIENDEVSPFSKLHLEGVRYFTIQELKALATLRTAAHIIELCERGDLKTALIESFMKQYLVTSKDKQLDSKQRDVMNLVTPTAKSMVG